jgi:hypothetical protein
MDGMSQVMGPNFGNALAQWSLHKMGEKKRPFHTTTLQNDVQAHV